MQGMHGIYEWENDHMFNVVKLVSESVGKVEE